MTYAFWTLIAVVCFQQYQLRRLRRGFAEVASDHKEHIERMRWRIYLLENVYVAEHN